MKWYSCKDKSITPPLCKDLLLACQPSHYPIVTIARWSGTCWYDPDDNDYYYRDTETDFWAYFPKHPELEERHINEK